MATRRPPVTAPQAGHSGEVPDELVVGALAAVWASDGVDLIDGKRRYAAARRAWEASERLDRRTSYKLLPARSPWRLTDPGADDRLARRGFTPDQIPWLRDVAATYPTERHRS